MKNESPTQWTRRRFGAARSKTDANARSSAKFGRKMVRSDYLEKKRQREKKKRKENVKWKPKRISHPRMLSPLRNLRLEERNSEKDYLCSVSGLSIIRATFLVSFPFGVFLFRDRRRITWSLYFRISAGETDSGTFSSLANEVVEEEFFVLRHDRYRPAIEKQTWPAEAKASRGNQRWLVRILDARFRFSVHTRDGEGGLGVVKFWIEKQLSWEFRYTLDWFIINIHVCVKNMFCHHSKWTLWKIERN